MELPEKISKPKWSLVQAVTISFMAIAVSLVAASFASILLDKTSIGDTEKNFIVYAINTAILLTIALIFLRRRRVQFSEFFSLPRKSSLLWMPVYFGIYFVASTSVQILLQFLPGYDASQNQDVGFTGVAGAGIALVFIALVILPPLGEEVIFRGILCYCFCAFVIKFTRIINRPTPIPQSIESYFNKLLSTIIMFAN